MNFSEALESMLAGNKVRRASWREKTYLYLNTCGIPGYLYQGNEANSDATQYCITKEDCVAEDWEEYERSLLSNNELEFLKKFVHFNSKKITHFRVYHEYYQKYIAFYTNCNEPACDILAIKGSIFERLEENQTYVLNNFGIHWTSIGI